MSRMKTVLKIISYTVLLVGIAIVAIAVYEAHQYLTAYHNRPPVLPPSLTASSSDSSGTGVVASSSTAIASYLNRTDFHSTLDTSNWSMYENTDYNYGLQYPSGVTYAEQGTSTIFTIPASTYFHWPLLDTVKITVTVATTCPSLVVSGDHAANFSINGYAFMRSAGNDVGAGNLYNEIAYDTTSDGMCYHLSLFDHGTNGSSFYVSDQDLITRYDAQHEVDMSGVLDIFDAMLASFKIRAVRG